ncbi:MAG TPA: phosphatidate cytidylyltransferase [Pirellulales bacterium]|nr:phosphatidate cytidylyltransferase [Pirellulales bacterium]
MLIWRLVLGAVFIGGVAGLCWADYHATAPGIFLLPLALVVATGATREMIDMLRRGGWQPAAWPVYLGNAAIVAANWFSRSGSLGDFDGPAFAFAFSVIVVFAVEMARYREPGRSSVNLGAAILVLAYVGWLMTFLVELRFVGGPQTGMAALVSLVIVVKMCDTGAYTIGRLIGRHKMAPRLSGGKTIEGLAGGLLFACLGSWCSFRFVVPGLASAALPALPGQTWLVFGLLVGFAGVLGDLAESLLKRDLGCKDSSTWMPGFGGVLDVIDSLLLAAPVGYVVWRWVS